MQDSCTKLTAEYINANKVSWSRRGWDPTLQWARKVLCNYNGALQRLTRLYEFFLDDDDEIKCVRRTRNTKKKKFSLAPIYKYGIQVPRQVKEAYHLDKDNTKTFWQDAMKK